MDRRAVVSRRQSPVAERNFEQLRVAGAVRGEEHPPIAREERALQKIRRMVDVRTVRDRADHAQAQIEIAARGQRGDLAVGYRSV